MQSSGQVELTSMGHGSSNVLAIGRNDHDELGPPWKASSSQRLRSFPHKKYFYGVHSGRKYSIYPAGSPDTKDMVYFVAGNNFDGQLGLNHSEPIDELQEVTYFRDHKLKVDRVCVNINGDSTFWITSNGDVYGNGDNFCGQLGLGDTRCRVQPVLIPDLINVTKHSLFQIADIQCSEFRSIALCVLNESNLRTLCRSWCPKKPPSDDVMALIVNYLGGGNRVYSTGNGSNDNHCRWNEMVQFQSQRIHQIRVGFRHALFLGKDGNLWGFGDNSNGQLGLKRQRDCVAEGKHTRDGSKHTRKSLNSVPQSLGFKIKMREIACGYQHNLAIDDHRRVYSWGNNLRGQCGYDDTLYGRQRLVGPRMIIWFENDEIIKIGCGYEHSYCCTAEGKHYLFGSNIYFECIRYGDRSPVKRPFCINAVVEKESEGRKIMSVSLGCNNTKVVLYDEELYLRTCESPKMSDGHVLMKP